MQMPHRGRRLKKIKKGVDKSTKISYIKHELGIPNSKELI